MKKLFALLLALLLCAGMVTPAFAEEEGSPPGVTRITAEWSGTIQASAYRVLPMISPDNVTITLYFEDGSTRAADSWHFDYENHYDLSWTRDVGNIIVQHDRTNRTFHFYYSNAALYVAYLPKSPSKTDAEYLATLPHASLEYTEDYMTQYFDSLSALPALQQNTPQTMTVDCSKADSAAVCFTPGLSYWYYVNVDSYSQAECNALSIYDSNFSLVARSRGKSTAPDIARLKAGETYYIIAEFSRNINAPAGEQGEVELTVKRDNFHILKTAFSFVSGIFGMLIYAFIFNPFLILSVLFHS